MSYIPNCREGENGYSQNDLKEIDRREIFGYDWAVENVVDNFFNNLEMLEDLEIERWLDRPYPDNIEYEATNPFNDDTEERTVNTYGDYLRFRILEWAEMHRNELITSILDNYED